MGSVSVTLDWVAPQVTVNAGLLVSVFLSAEVKVTLWPPVMLKVKDEPLVSMKSSSNVPPPKIVYSLLSLGRIRVEFSETVTTAAETNAGASVKIIRRLNFLM